MATASEECVNCGAAYHASGGDFFCSPCMLRVDRQAEIFGLILKISRKADELEKEILDLKSKLEKSEKTLSLILPLALAYSREHLVSGEAFYTREVYHLLEDLEARDGE